MHIPRKNLWLRICGQDSDQTGGTPFIESRSKFDVGHQPIGSPRRNSGMTQVNMSFDSARAKQSAVGVSWARLQGGEQHPWISSSRAMATSPCCFCKHCIKLVDVLASQITQQKTIKSSKNIPAKCERPAIPEEGGIKTI
jgi:hypothetical protein